MKEILKLYQKNKSFFKNQDRYFKYLDEKPLRFTPIVYKYWMEDFNLKKHHQILNNLEKFIASKNYLFLDIKDEFINKN